MEFLKIFFLITFFSCGAQRSSIPKDGDHIKKYRLSRQFPQIGKYDGKLLGYEYNEVYLYSTPTKIIYQIPYEHYVHDSVRRLENRTMYLEQIYNISGGYFTDSSESIFRRPVNIDSTLEKQWFSISLFTNMDNFVIKPLSSEALKDKLKTLSKTYSFYHRTDAAFKGTIILNYTSAIHLNSFSIAKQVDTIPDKKLYSLLILNDARKVKGYELSIDAIKQSRKLEEVPEHSLPEIVKSFSDASKLSQQP